MNAACSRGYRHFIAFIIIAFIMGVNLLAPTIVAQASARPEPPDWYAGDAHVHRGIGCGREHEKEMLTPAQLLEMMKPNNLAVISVLSDIGNGELKYIEKDLPLMTGRTILSPRQIASCTGMPSGTTIPTVSPSRGR